MCPQYHRTLKNVAAEQPYQHALFFTSYALSQAQWSFDEKLAVFDELTLEETQSSLKRFFMHSFADCFIYGNITKPVYTLLLNNLALNFLEFSEPRFEETIIFASSRGFNVTS